MEYDDLLLILMLSDICKFNDRYKVGLTLVDN